MTHSTLVPETDADTRFHDSILKSLSEGVVVASAKGELLYFNPVATELLGIGVIQGEARAWVELEDGTQLEVNYLKTGDFFGEMALLTGEKRSAYVTTTTPAFLGEVTKADIAPFLVKHPEIVTEMSKELTRRKIRGMQRLDSYQDYQIDHQEISNQYSSSIKRFFGLH